MLLDNLLSESDQCFDENGLFHHNRLLASALENSPDTIALCVPEKTMALLLTEETALAKYHLHALFEIEPDILSKRPINLSLFVFNRESVDEILVGIWEKHKNVEYYELDFNDIESSSTPIDPYMASINHYLESLEFGSDWYYPAVASQFCKIPSSSFDPSFPSAFYYSNKFLAIMQETDPSLIVKLGDIASIIEPQILMGNDLVVQSYKKRPFEIGLCSLESKTDTMLLEDDIVVTPDDIFLASEKPTKEYCVSAEHLVIRNPSISPESLYVFLDSRVGKALVNQSMRENLTKDNLTKIYSSTTVILPTLDANQYKIIHTIEYSKTGEELHNYSLTRQSSQKPEARESLLYKELIAVASACRTKGALDIIKTDIHEIEACFNAQAYKAAMILAGSVLEAFLIDWLSEINGINYFKENYPAYEKSGSLRPPNLADYIDGIKEIKKPNWMEPAEKAHHIRNKRNLVHAKLLLKKDAVIDELACTQVIDYLKEVIATRASL